VIESLPARFHILLPHSLAVQNRRLDLAEAGGIARDIYAVSNLQTAFNTSVPTAIRGCVR